jgi:electron transfer flavoprotein alpha/beta subunit
MNILLAFKAEPDLGMLAEKDWRMAVASGQGPDISQVRAAAGVDEQAGAEMLLRARDNNPAVSLTALTVGNHRANHALRHFAALGFARPVLMETEDALRFSPARVAGCIADWARQNQEQLIVLGSQSGEGQNGQTGWLLAEMLGWPCIAGVSDFSIKDDMALVTQEVGEQQCCWSVRLPAILIVNNKGQIALRVPGMRQRLAAANCLITRIAPPVTEQAWLTCQRLTRSENRRECIMIEGLDIQEKIQRLWDEHLRQRMAE